MDTLKFGIDWVSRIHAENDQVEAIKIISGFGEVFDKLNSFEPHVRDEILKLFLELWEASKGETCAN